MRPAILITVALAGAGIACGAWQRSLETGYGVAVDQPPPHPLEYFKPDPCSRPSSDRVTRALDCDFGGGPNPRVTADVHLLGKAGAFAVYEAAYTRDGFKYPNQDVKAILIQTGRNEYHEIDVRARNGYSFPDSGLLMIRNRPALDVRSHDGGQNILIQHRLYVFDASGANLVDFSSVDAAVKAAIPGNMSIRLFDNDLAAGARYVTVYRNDLNLPPVAVTERARITISYRLEGAKVVITGSKYEPFLEGH